MDERVQRELPQAWSGVLRGWPVEQPRRRLPVRFDNELCRRELPPTHIFRRRHRPGRHYRGQSTAPETENQAVELLTSQQRHRS